MSRPGAGGPRRRIPPLAFCRPLGGICPSLIERFFFFFRRLGRCESPPLIPPFSGLHATEPPAPPPDQLSALACLALKPLRLPAGAPSCGALPGACGLEAWSGPACIHKRGAGRVAALTYRAGNPKLPFREKRGPRSPRRVLGLLELAKEMARSSGGTFVPL